MPQKPLPHAQINWAHPLAQGLIKSFPMLEPSQAVARDYGPYQFNLTIEAGTPTYPIAQHGPVFALAGNTYMDQGFDAATVGVGSAGFAISVRFKRGSASAGTGGIFSWAASSGAAAPWILFNETGTDTRWYFNTNYRVQAATDTAWHHDVVVYDGATYTVYRDGAILGTYTGTTSGNYGNSSSIFVGNGFGGSFNGGNIDHVHIWRRPLDAGSVQELVRDPFCMYRRARQQFLYVALPPVEPPAPNPPTFTPDVYGVDILFTDDLQVTSKGDWKLVTGLENLRRAIYRRLITKPGEFKLRPEYGVGVQLYVKKPHTRANLDRLRQATIANLAREKRLESVEVTFESQSIGGVQALVMHLKARALNRELKFKPFTFTEKGGS